MAISYSKTTWINGASPAINATNLNKIENGIANATSEINTIASSVASIQSVATTAVTNVAFDSANARITQTINGSTTAVVSS